MDRARAIAATPVKRPSSVAAPLASPSSKVSLASTHEASWSEDSSISLSEDVLVEVTDDSSTEDSEYSDDRGRAASLPAHASAASRSLAGLASNCRLVLDQFDQLEQTREVRALEAELVQLLRVHDERTSFGNWRQVARSLVAVDLLYLSGFGVPVAIGKHYGMPQLSLVSGVLLVLLQPLAAALRSGTANSEATSEYLKQAQILLVKVRCVAANTGPQPGEDDPWQDFDAGRMLKNFGLTVVTDDLAFLFFWVGYTIKNVAYRSAGKSEAADIGMHLLAGCAAAAAMWFTSQAARYRMWPDSYARTPDRGMLDRQVAYHEALDTLLGEFGDDNRVAALKSENRALLDAARKENTGLAERLRTEYRSLFNERLLNSLTTMAGMAVIQFPVALTALYGLGLMRSEPDSEHAAMLDTVPPMLLGVGLAFQKEASWLLGLAASGVLGLFERLSNHCGPQAADQPDDGMRQREWQERTALLKYTTPWG